MIFFWKELLRRLFHDLRMAMVSDKAVGVLVKRLIDATKRAPRRFRGRTKTSAKEDDTERHEAEAAGSAGNAGWLELRTGYATCLSLSAANRSDDDGVLFLFSERACPALHDAPHAPAGSPVPLNASVEFGAWRITTRVAKSDESEPGGDQNKDALASTPVFSSVDELFAGRFGSVCPVRLFSLKWLHITHACVRVARYWLAVPAAHVGADREGARALVVANENARLPRAVRVLDTLFTSANGRARPHHDARIRRVVPVIVPREHDEERAPTILVRVEYAFIGAGKAAKTANGASGDSNGVWGISL